MVMDMVMGMGMVTDIQVTITETRVIKRTDSTR